MEQKSLKWKIENNRKINKSKNCLFKKIKLTKPSARLLKEQKEADANYSNKKRMGHHEDLQKFKKKQL